MTRHHVTASRTRAHRRHTATALLLGACLLAAGALAGGGLAEGAASPVQKIAPGLLHRLKDLADRGDLHETLPLIVQTWGAPGDREFDDVDGLGGSPGPAFKTIHGFPARLPARSVLDLAGRPSVKHLSYDWPVKAHLDTAGVSTGALAAVSGPSGTPLIGSGVAVAVLDSGVAPSPDFGPTNSTIAAEIDVVEPDDVLADPFGHGTHVAGIIAGSGAASSVPGAFRTFRGIAPGVRIVSVKVLDHEGRSRVSEVLAGVDWVIQNHEQYGIRVMNLSLGHPVDESYWTDPLCQALETAWRDGIVVVVSAGDSGGRGFATITSPANDPLVISVGAAHDWNTLETSDDLVASFSSSGPTALDGVIKPDIVAPGTGIVSLRAAGSYIDALLPARRLKLADFMTGAEDGGADSPYIALSGTSAAAPMVAGAAAILLQQDPQATPDDVKARLMIGARKMNEAIVARGAGLLDIPASLQLGAAGLIADESTSPHLIVIANRDGTLSVELQEIGTAWGDPKTWASGLVWGEAAIWGVSPMWTDAGVWAEIAVPGSPDEGYDPEIVVWGSQ